MFHGDKIIDISHACVSYEIEACIEASAIFREITAGISPGMALRIIKGQEWPACESSHSELIPITICAIL